MSGTYVGRVFAFLLYRILLQQVRTSFWTSWVHVKKTTITITGTSLNTQMCGYFNTVSCPDMWALDAFHVHTCIPLLVCPICYNHQCFVNSALTDNVKDWFLVIRSEWFLLYIINECSSHCCLEQVSCDSIPFQKQN